MTDPRRIIVEASNRRGLGGVGVALIRPGQPVEYLCDGPADAKGGVPITADTVFRIASISKTMTAIGLLQLRDEGKCALDDPVNDHLRHITLAPPAGAPPVTFRHLLTHTAGIGELPKVAGLLNRASWGMGPPGTAGADLAAMYGGTLRTEVAAGTKWAYANHGFAILGQLVEDISGQPFAEYMTEHVFDPLGMASTGYVRTERTGAQLATGSQWILGRFRQQKDYDLTILGAGSVLSSLSDMATYATWLSKSGHSRSRRVLRAATLQEMMSSQYSIDQRLPGLGLAFFLGEFGSHRVAGHDGNVPGFASALLVAPDDGLGVVVLTNTATFVGANLLAASLMRSLLAVPEPADQVATVLAPNRPHLWSELVGCYAPAPGFLTNFRVWQMLGGEVQVVVRKRQLTLQALSPFRTVRRGVALRPADDDDPLHFAFELDGMLVHVVFSRDAAGAIDRVAVGRPVSVTFHRRDAWRSSRRRLRVLGAVAAMATLRRHRGRRRRP